MNMKKIKVKILKENKLNEMCGPEPQPEPVIGPVIGIHPDDEPCGCPDMAHNHDNHEGSMSRSQLMLIEMIADHDDLPEWVEYKITLANDYIAKVKHFIEGELAREQGMLENKKK